MANFVVIIDSDAAQRASFEREVQPQLRIVPGLQLDQCGAGELRALWAVAAGVPVSCACAVDSAAIIWGDAIEERDGQRIDAAQLKARWWGPRPSPAPLDGYHAALTYDATRRRLTVGADLLGLYPVYYADLGDALLIGSSPELFRWYPRFDPRVDPAALAAVMLTMHLVEGRTLCRGARRLAAGHLLRWEHGRGCSEVEQYRVIPSRKFYALPFSSHEALLAQALGESTRRHVPAGQQYGLMLSGGRDSRLLAGYMHSHGVKVSAFTLGRHEDLEIECARAVARALKLDHEVAEIHETDYLDYAIRQATWEHGAQGFNTVMGWGMPALVREMPRYMVNGYLGDAIFGGSHIHWARVAGAHEMSFNAFFGQINAYGIHPDRLRMLTRAEVFKDSIDETLEAIRTRYHSYSELESERAWCFDLYHRQRYHIGGEVWRLSFGAWPICPFVDRRLLEVCAGMPASSLAERRGQDAVLCEHFPHLAELPLDRNSHVATPLRPRLRYLIARAIRSRTARRAPQPERRRYYRLWNINGPGWMAVRREAEKYRSLTYDWFDRDALAAILPPPEVKITYKDGIIDTSGLKSILGFMLWLGLSARTRSEAVRGVRPVLVAQTGSDCPCV